MADLTFTVEQVPDMRTAAIVRINGAIDAKTVVLFQEKLDQLQKEGYTRFILDMAGIKYVNSTGLGTLVNVADALENRGGGIALVKIHPKVKVVFDMLGLNAFFKIFSNESEALAYFQKLENGPVKSTTGEIPPPAPRSSILGSQPTAPKEPAPAKQEVLPPRGMTHSSPTAPSLPPSSAISTKATVPHEPGAPFSLVCGVCGVKLNIPKPGSYKCPRCGTFFKLQKDGKAAFTERQKAASLQMKLACTDECSEGLAEFVGVMANRIGFSAAEIAAVKESIIEICTAITEKAYQNKPYECYNVVLNPSSTELRMQISDYGTFIYDTKSCFDRSRQTMDEFEHKQHPKGGNVISLGKKFQ